MNELKNEAAEQLSETLQTNGTLKLVDLRKG